MPLVEHPLTAKITFTGSDATGRIINETAARGFKKVGLELGGKSPNIVFEDAVIEDAVNGAVSGIFAATGQTCIAGSRLLLQESIHDEFVEKLLALAKTARMGDPDEPGDAGRARSPRSRSTRRCLSYIDVGQERRRQAAHGRRAGDAARMRQGLVRRADHLHRRRQQDAHRAGGSVRSGAVDHSASRTKTTRCASPTTCASAWVRASGPATSGRAIRMSERIKAGTVWVNTYRAVSFMSPFGGYKDSGVGRENGQSAIYEYLQMKSVWINTGVKTGNPFVMR